MHVARTIADGLAVKAALHAHALPAGGARVAVADVGVVVLDVAARDAQSAALGGGGGRGGEEHCGHDRGPAKSHLQNSTARVNVHGVQVQWGPVGASYMKWVAHSLFGDRCYTLKHLCYRGHSIGTPGCGSGKAEDWQCSTR